MKCPGVESPPLTAIGYVVRHCPDCQDNREAVDVLRETLRLFTSAPSGMPICACRSGQRGRCAYCIARKMIDRYERTSHA